MMMLDAAQAGNLGEVYRLVNNGTSIEARNDSGDTALILAAKHGHIPVVAWLLNQGADVDAYNTVRNETALILYSVVTRFSPTKRYI